MAAEPESIDLDGLDVAETEVEAEVATATAVGPLALGSPDEPIDLDDIQINLDFGADDEDEPEADGLLNLDFGDEAEAEAAESGVKLDDSDDVARAVREKLRQDMVGKEGDWYVVHTYSGMEKRVKSNLDSRVKTLNMEDYIFESVVPTEDIVEIRNGQKKTVTRTVIPGYVLVRMDLTDESWSAVRHTPSVTGFVGHANNPVPLGLDEVVEMLLPSALAAQAAAEGGKPARRKKVELVDFRVGDSVMLTDGPFTGVHATITEINVHSQRLKATLEFMGRDTPVDLTLDQVQKI
ncbi:MAG: transcription termination/antitermination protein NusG [Propionibacteriaceae bacterium]|nr:transcription termination/antitermination protein NusG [Propionibacteriaceae bacterium]